MNYSKELKENVLAQEHDGLLEDGRKWRKLMDSSLGSMFENATFDGNKVVFGPATARSVICLLTEEHWGEIEQNRIDAERWNAIYGCARMHFMGSAGFKFDYADEETDGGRKLKDVKQVRVNPELHCLQFGMEFWSKHPINRSVYPDDVERSILLTFVDHIRAEKSRADDLEEQLRVKLDDVKSPRQ